MDHRSQNVSVRSSGHRQQQQQQQRSSAPVTTGDSQAAEDRNDYYYYYEYSEPRVVIGRDLRKAIEQLRSVPTLKCDRNPPAQDWNGKGGEARRTRKDGGSGGGSPQRRQVRSVEGSPPPAATDSAGGRHRKSASTTGHRAGSDGRLTYTAADGGDDVEYYGGGGSAMPWKIKRVRKQKLKRPPDPDEASVVNTSREVAARGSVKDGSRHAAGRREGDADGGVEGGDEADGVTAIWKKKDTETPDAETKRSTESLDSVVERILENIDGGLDEDLEEELREEERRRSDDSKKRRRPQGAVRVTDVRPPSNQTSLPAAVPQSSPGRRRPPPPPPKPKNISKNGDRKTSTEQRLETCISDKNVTVYAEPNNNANLTSKQTTKTPPIPPPKPSNSVSKPINVVHGKSVSSKRVEVSLEDLFEQAVESLATTDTKTVAVDELWDDERRRRPAVVEEPPRSTVAPPGKKYRGEDNFQQEVCDEDVHGPNCRQLKVVTTFDETAARKDDFSRISRGFAVVEKIEKKKSASAASKPPSRADEIIVDVVAAAPEVEMVPPSSMATVAAVAADKENQSTGERSSSFRQRTVISAATSSTPSELKTNDDSQDGTQDRPGQQQQQRDNAGSGLSRSSSATWDSVSVDSLLVYDDDLTTVRGVYSTLHTVRGDDGYCGDVDAASTTTKTSEEYFVDSLKRLKREFQRHAAAAAAERNKMDGREVDPSVQTTRADPTAVDEVSDRNKEQEKLKTSEPLPDVVDASTETSCLEQPSEAELPVAAEDVARRPPESEAPVCRDRVVGGDVARILSDSTTTQEVTIKVRLPTDIRARMKEQQRQQFRAKRPQSAAPMASRVPFRELRLHREIRFLDADDNDVERSRTAGSRAAAITSSAKIDLRICGTAVDITHGESGYDELPVAVSSSDDAAKSTVGGLVAIPGCTVEHESSSTSRSVDLVPCPTDSTPTRVDVTQVDSVRVLHVPGKGARLRAEQAYQMPSLQAVVDGVRAAMLDDRKLRTAGVGVKCEAVETITSTGGRLEGPDGPMTPPVVHSIAVDCLPVDTQTTE